MYAIRSYYACSSRSSARCWSGSAVSSRDWSPPRGGCWGWSSPPSAWCSATPTGSSSSATAARPRASRITSYNVCYTKLLRTARKLRRLHDNRILAGFAGSTADAFTLFEKFDAKLQEFRGNLPRAAVALAKDWRTDRILRKLEALLIVADAETTLVLSGAGDVIEPDDGIAAIGSGGAYALAAARALVADSPLPAGEIAEKALRIAADICIYTNDRLVREDLT